MHNIASIYRFNTPFLNLENEKERLVFLVKKVEKSIEFDWIKYKKTTSKEWIYYKVELTFEEILWKIEFYFISQVDKKIYHLPLFKLNIFIDFKFLENNSLKTKLVKFLNNIFECFDWLDEKEFLIDIDNNVYFETGVFRKNIYPSYDFSDIEKIRENFEWENWEKLLEDFISKFSKWNFELTIQKAEYYHNLHSILLYFIYLVFLMYQNVEKTSNAENELNNSKSEWIFESHIDLMKKRLSYVKDIHQMTFDRYKDKLELFFKMF